MRHRHEMKHEKDKSGKRFKVHTYTFCLRTFVTLPLDSTCVSNRQVNKRHFPKRSHHFKRNAQHFTVIHAQCTLHNGIFDGTLTAGAIGDEPYCKFSNPVASALKPFFKSPLILLAFRSHPLGDRTCPIRRR